jgi:hypothetical protein
MELFAFWSETRSVFTVYETQGRNKITRRKKKSVRGTQEGRVTRRYEGRDSVR